ncbi:hypothetical protein N0V85_007329 [Neurospora sp. IMI 360204]|nr:hypothetical protein N0V85_007329 [Neurospora sp. IMI 360204]
MTSHPEFNERTTGTEVASVSPKGIGAATAFAFASQAPDLLILASRTKSKLEAVGDQIRNRYPDTRVELVTLDLSSQKAIREAVAEITTLTDKLDILVNNAAINAQTRQATPEGLEMTFGTNHIGTFLFTNLLLPLLRNAAKANPSPGATRIISLASAGHGLSPIRFSDYNFEPKEVPPEEDHLKPLPGSFARCTEDGYNGMVTYGQSKTANILFTLYLQKYLAGQGLMAYTLHPGTIDTKLGRDQDPDVQDQFKKMGLYWKSQDQGCSTTLVAALDPALSELKGLYLVDCQISDPCEHAKDAVAAERLWKLSEDIIGEKFSLED